MKTMTSRKKKMKIRESDCTTGIYNSRIREYLLQGEGQHIEFKRKVSQLDKIVRELVAFANSGGGTLLIGVADDGRVPGIKDPEEESFAVRQAIEQYIRPTLRYQEEVVSIAPGRYVLMYHVKPSTRLPCLVKQKRFTTCYVRVNDQSIKASAEMKEILRRRHNRHTRLIRLGETEHFLLNYLANHPYITLQTFSAQRNLTRKQASRKLIYLVLANLLTLTPTDRGDRYSLAYATDTER
jgi:predicted HTH transcriptional regulator